MRGLKVTLAVLVASLAVVASAAAATQGEDKVTLCHAAGLEGTTQYVTITVGYPAAYGEAGHFYENGTPRAGHEQDYLGECKTEEPPPPPPSGKCPEGYVQQGEDPILCLKTETKVVTVTVEVPGPERVVERVVEVPVEKIVEKVVEVPVDRVVTKTVVKVKRVPVVKTKTVVKWKTKTVTTKTACKCSAGYRLWKGACHPIVRGNG